MMAAKYVSEPSNNAETSGTTYSCEKNLSMTFSLQFYPETRAKIYPIYKYSNVSHGVLRETIFVSLNID